MHVHVPAVGENERGVPKAVLAFFTDSRRYRLLSPNPSLGTCEIYALSDGSTDGLPVYFTGRFTNTLPSFVNIARNSLGQNNALLSALEEIFLATEEFRVSWLLT